MIARDHVLAIAVGKPSDAFGPSYSIFDGDDHDRGRRCPRLPGPPFMFIDAVPTVSTPMLQMEAGGTLRARFTPKADDWFFAAEGGDESMPFSVYLETPLQACGFYSTYMGSALQSEVDFVYRNLGGSGVVKRKVFPGTTMTSVINATKVSASGGMIIQDFDFHVFDEQGSLYEGHTTFGFFTKEAMAKQVGLRGETLKIPELAPDVTEEPYPSHRALPHGRLELLDCIESFWKTGGEAGLGYARARKTIDPEEWFFKAHFFQDPVVPGSLGLESFLQVMKYMALSGARGHDIVAFESPALGMRHQWTYRGQVLPSAGTVMVDVEVVSYDDDVMTANGYLSVDGLMIYKMEGFALRLVYR